MIKLMEPEEVSKFWPNIQAHITDSLNAYEPYVGSQALREALTGRMQVWMIFGDGEEAFKGFMTTKIIRTQSGRDLLIYSLSGRNVGIETWKAGLQILKKYANNIRANRIVAEIRDNDLKSMVERLGFEVETVHKIYLGVPYESVHESSDTNGRLNGGGESES